MDNAIYYTISIGSWISHEHEVYGGSELYPAQTMDPRRLRLAIRGAIYGINGGNSDPSSGKM